MARDKSANLPALTTQMDPWAEAQQRMRSALTVQSPREARALARLNRASIAGLEWQGAYARALAYCIDEHTRVVQAMDRFYAAGTQLQARRDREVVADETRAIADADAVVEAEHKRALAKKRRQKEMLEADLEIMEAKHRLEAKETFKPMQFELGHIRAETRQRDAELEKRTAESALFKLLDGVREQAAKDGRPVGDWLNDRIAFLEEQAREAAADGQDTADVLAELNVLKKLRAAL
jgi:hypothetical protein